MGRLALFTVVALGAISLIAANSSTTVAPSTNATTSAAIAAGAECSGPSAVCVAGYSCQVKPAVTSTSTAAASAGNTTTAAAGSATTAAGATSTAAATTTTTTTTRPACVNGTFPNGTNCTGSRRLSFSAPSYSLSFGNIAYRRLQTVYTCQVTPSSTTTTTLPAGAASAQIKFAADFTTTLAKYGGTLEEQKKKFGDDFVAIVANATGEPASRFQVISVSPGSIIVDLRILPSATGSTAAPSATALVQAVTTQAADPNSKLQTAAKSIPALQAAFAAGVTVVDTTPTTTTTKGSTSAAAFAVPAAVLAALAFVH